MGKASRLKAMNMNGATMIEGDPKIRAKKCVEAVNAIVKQYRCQMYAECLVSPKGVRSFVQIEPIVDQEVPTGIIQPS